MAFRQAVSHPSPTILPTSRDPRILRNIPRTVYATVNIRAPEIQKLRGPQNYGTWSLEARAIFIREGLWEIVSGEESEPKKPVLVDDRDLSVEEKEDAQKHYGEELELYEEAHAEWVCKNRKAWWKIIDIAGNGPRGCVQSTRNAHDLWAKFRRLYLDDDLATRDRVFMSLARIDYSQFSDLHAYKTEFRKHKAKLREMGLEIPDWMLSTFYRAGLGKLPELMPP